MSENEVPNSDDDFSEKTNATINFIIQKYEPQLLELLKYNKQSPTQNSYRRIIGFCVRMNQKFIAPMGSRLSNNNEDLSECIKQMNKVSSNISPHDKMHFMSLANEIGETYIKVWKSM
jgi:hypothetical protein